MLDIVFEAKFYQMAVLCHAEVKQGRTTIFSCWTWSVSHYSLDIDKRIVAQYDLNDLPIKST